jgi:hypothetical protein
VADPEIAGRTLEVSLQPDEDVSRGLCSPGHLKTQPALFHTCIIVWKPPVYLGGDLIGIEGILVLKLLVGVAGIGPYEPKTLFCNILFADSIKIPRLLPMSRGLSSLMVSPTLSF